MAFSVSDAQGPVSYKLVKVSNKAVKKKISITKKGKITVKKGLKKGTYKLTVKITAAGNADFDKMTKKVTVTVKVK